MKVKEAGFYRSRFLRITFKQRKLGNNSDFIEFLSSDSSMHIRRVLALKVQHFYVFALRLGSCGVTWWPKWVVLHISWRVSARKALGIISSALRYWLAPWWGGGAKRPPSTFLHTAKKRKQISPPNFAYAFVHEFYTPWPKEHVKALIGRP